MSETKTGTVADISDDQLLRRVMRKVTSRNRQQPAWARVSDYFGLGSTYSWQLCRRFGIDPDTGKVDDPETYWGRTPSPPEA